jgi:hypothetical protein
MDAQSTNYTGSYIAINNIQSPLGGFEVNAIKLSTTVSNISSLPNSTNAALISEFYQYMKNNGASECHTNNSLKTNMAFAKFLSPNVTFYDIERKKEIITFLDTKIKSIEKEQSDSTKFEYL